jgi:peptidoglycan/LPS O-acetylase OafA/YrhL
MGSKHTKGDWAFAGLDFLRFALAFTVVIGHLSLSTLQTAWPDMSAYGVIAVGGFFVLSGYTIRAMGLRSSGFDAAAFISERLSRLLSVSVLALLVTVLADVASAQLAPLYYTQSFGEAQEGPLLRVVANLLLVSQPYGLDITPFSNSPFWSLSYEAGFYSMWAAFMFWRVAGGSVAWLLAVAFLAGTHVLAMLPLWLLGVLLFDMGRPGWRASRLLGALVIGVAVAGLGTLVVLNGQGMHGLRHSVHLGIAWSFAQLGMPPARVHELVIFGALGAFMLLLPALAVAQRITAWREAPGWLMRVARALGELTFPLYLLHFPLMVLARAAKGAPLDGLPEKLALLAGLLLLAHKLVPVTNKLKGWMRLGLLTMLRRPVHAPVLT